MRELLRAFRSSDLRDLTRLAIDQGWDAYMNGGGHVQVVNPANGQRVSVSTTAASSHRGHTLANARAAFRRAGLVLTPPPPTRTPIPEALPMATHPTHATAEPVPEGELAPNVNPLHPAARKAGGAFSLLAPKVPTDIAGHRVLVGERVDGNWVAEMAWPGMKSGRRQWMSKDGREELVARIERDLAEDRPARHLRSTGADVNPPTSAPTLPPFVAERVPERYTNGSSPDTSWRAVGVAQEEFPLASALDHLHASVAPALEALEAAGKMDAAGLLRSELALTPTEQELLRLWRRVTHGDD